MNLLLEIIFWKYFCKVGLLFVSDRKSEYISVAVSLDVKILLFLIRWCFRMRRVLSLFDSFFFRFSFQIWRIEWTKGTHWISVIFLMRYWFFQISQSLKQQFLSTNFFEKLIIFWENLKIGNLCLFYKPQICIRQCMISVWNVKMQMDGAHWKHRLEVVLHLTWKHSHILFINSMQYVIHLLYPILLSFNLVLQRILLLNL